ncbi:IclR family transcriptional regulator [Vreelandella populi]|uniref:IclR family transcriptional regulator n=1 Tax=Vreelandella populi TaxID=2498858 RepID=A0A433L7S7_9GAMM|nr:IclR family transcriptional regulator C-terminal domain-containing protein [Halomonas populi]RUR43427.1 hypothetical protein ELY37_17115 [Halomonas populi]
MTKSSSDIHKYESLEKNETGQHYLTGLAQAANEPKDQASLVPALQKAIRLLRLMNAERRPLSLAEMAVKLSISKSHCHGLLKTLVHFDWLRFDPTARNYYLHVGVSRDLSSILDERMNHSTLRPVMEDFTARTGISCVLSEPMPDHSFLIVDQVSAINDIEIFYPSGYRLPADATAHMRAYLAWQKEFEIDAWFAIAQLKKYTIQTASGANDARMAIRETRERGYARSVGEFTEGIMALALPVFSREGRVRYIFDCVGRIETLAQREKVMAEALVQSVSRIHEMFGSKLPPDFPRPMPRDKTTT